MVYLTSLYWNFRRINPEGNETWCPVCDPTQSQPWLENEPWVELRELEPVRDGAFSLLYLLGK